MIATRKNSPIASSPDRTPPRVGLMVLVALYLLVGLYGLQSYPAPWVDEGWIGEVAAVISAGHPPGSPSHGTLYHYNDRLFWMPPLYFYVLGGWFSLFSVDLIAGRMLNGAFGLLALVLLFEYGRRRIGSTGAFLAGLVLVLEPFAWKTFRTVRFESLTTLLGLALIAALDRALAVEKPGGAKALRWWLVTGTIAGLLLNVHPNAVLFCAGALTVVMARRGVRAFRDRGPWAALGISVLWCLPYILYCLSDAGAGFENLKGQNSFHLNAGAAEGPPMLREWTRYASFFPWPYRAPSALAAMAVLASALFNVRSPFTRTMLLPMATVMTGLLFLPNKTLLYLVPLTPFLALLAGDWWRRTRSWKPAAALLILLVSGAAVEAGLLHRNRDCDFRLAFRDIQAELKPTDRAAGTFVTWWAVQPRPFHEFSRGATIEAVTAFRPTVILLGDRQWVQEVPGRFGPLARDLERLFASRGRNVAETGDDCLGRIVLWRFTE